MTGGVIGGIALLGAIGAVARASVQGLAATRERIPFFWGTLAVNLSGALALGLLHGAGVHGTALKLVGAGFLGSFTTFSGWMVETDRLNSESRRLEVGYLLGALLAGLLAVWLGNLVGTQL